MIQSHLVIGLGYGDEGKGSWVDHLARKHEIDLVVRFNGGVQAHHHTVLADGRFHGFRQFSAGSFIPRVRTLLSRFVLVEPEMLFTEAEMLADLGVRNPHDKVLISREAPVITPFARLLNQILEVYRGGGRHGSTGWGIGITQRDVETLGSRALYVRDLESPELFDKLRWLGERMLEEAMQYENEETAELLDMLRHTDIEFYVQKFRQVYERFTVLSEDQVGDMLRTQDSVFEGAQGVLLDQQYGFFPHVTRSNCTFENAEALLADAGFSGEVNRVGLLRGYGTRHGAGPFVTEEPELDVPPCHNATNVWQGSFRVGWFDAVSARYALKVVGGVDTLAITNLDRMSGLSEIKVANKYRSLDPRYFTEDGSIRVLKTDITKLGDRCDALEKVQPEYTEHEGWKDNQQAMEGYLEYLGNELGTRVNAYSESELDHKSYR